MAKKKTVTKTNRRQPKADSMAHIAEQLRPLAEPVDALELNPANAVKHDAASLNAIAASLRKYGQRTPIVVNEKDNVVLKGNGTLQAARQLGWKTIAVVWVKDDPSTATGYAIADNRSAEFAQWDDAILAEQLAAVHADDADLFDALLLADLCEGAGDAILEQEHVEFDAETLPPEVEVKACYQVVIECADEEDQQAVYEEQTAAGRTCKCLTI